MASKGRIYFIVLKAGRAVSYGCAKSRKEFLERKEAIEALANDIKVQKVGVKMFKKVRKQVLESDGRKVLMKRLKVNRRDLNGYRCRS
ncbi:hypothetical protein QIT38_gp27 [Methanocaldococcus fervens tailed virus 1]|uniref:Uncharacterized protein n=2 Tax=root TaxID=1 RepID=C7P5I9_METFA|nr:hypothetical protein [Methanocaldococcus fervens]YP_010772322.1 hypothetical protein QIT38_gp27 [Methanocaldococcus fervens tailed virus 1]ACV25367.1 hypothetical protein Mefer_1564 [Methanocaldococcus fervens AG86]QNO11497.1 hypothetical protein [Methanocaldococcus fervens tailed virus 1]